MGDRRRFRSRRGASAPTDFELELLVRREFSGAVRRARRGCRSPVELLDAAEVVLAEEMAAVARPSMAVRPAAYRDGMADDSVVRKFVPPGSRGFVLLEPVEDYEFESQELTKLAVEYMKPPLRLGTFVQRFADDGRAT